MQALALAPVIGIDAAALVGVELSALRRAAAAIAMQAAWRGQRGRVTTVLRAARRGRRGRVTAMSRRAMLEMMRSLGYELLASVDTDAAYFVRAAMVFKATPAHRTGPCGFHIAPVGVVWPLSRYLDPPPFSSGWFEKHRLITH
jgi:hypothetical protein